MPGTNFPPSLIVPQGNSMGANPWREFLSSAGTTENGAWGGAGARIVLTVDIPWDRLTDTSPGGAIPSILGFAQYAPNYGATLPPGPGRILRTLPMQNPAYPFLFAIEISGVEPKQFTGKLTAKGRGGIRGSASNFWAGRTTIVFTHYNMNLVTDDAILGSAFSSSGLLPSLALGAEINRMVTRRVRPTSQYLSIDRGVQSFQFIPSAPNPGQAFAQGVNKLISTLELKIIWHQVPERAILDPVTGLPTNLQQASGKVNSTYWPNPCGVPPPSTPSGMQPPGFLPQTVLCESVEITPIQQPLDPLSVQVGGIVNQLDGVFIPSRCFEVTWNMKVFNPPTPANHEMHGWQTCPQFTGQTTWLYAGVTSNGQLNGARLYEEQDFNRCVCVAL